MVKIFNQFVLRASYCVTEVVQALPFVKLFLQYYKGMIPYISMLYSKEYFVFV